MAEITLADGCEAVPIVRPGSVAELAEHVRTAGAVFPVGGRTHWHIGGPPQVNGRPSLAIETTGLDQVIDYPALRVDVDRLRREGQPGYKHLPVEKLDYIRGNLLFWYGDLDAALINLREATQHTDQLDLGTAQLAWFRLGQTLDLMNRHDEAVPAYREASQVEAQSDIGAEAKHYISNPYHRKRTHQTG